MSKKPDFHPLTQDNLEAVYELFQRNKPFFLPTLEYFKRGTLGEKYFDPDLTLIVNNEAGSPIAALIAIIKKGWVRKNCYLKACMVDKAFRRQEIATAMLKELTSRAKKRLSFFSRIRYGDSLPRYWEPGVDLRHTSLLLFLKKNGFKTHRIRLNLTCSLTGEIQQPASEKNGFTFQRAKPEDRAATVQFVTENFRLGTWAGETAISFENSPPTTFIAKDENGEIVGWATHSANHLGSFGPTGVKKTLRGKGIGGELLRWCIWDQKHMGLQECSILWVEGHNLFFYSKVLGAYIHPIFYPMSRRL